LPSAAALLAHRLGVPRAASFDVVAACAGSLFGISVAEKFIATGAAQRILVIGAETLSVITNWTDRNTCVLMGDGAGAVVLERSTSSGPGFIDTQLYTDANLWNAITIPAGGSKTPLTQALIDEHQDRMIMNGREVYKLATRVLPEAAERILKENGYGSDDVTHVVAHQANLRILEAVSDRLHIPMERFVTNIERYGNTSSASVLLTFDEAVRDGRMHPGDLVVMLAIGAGMAWAAALYRV
jgi:3-oxoacyl-[acyl-carrier-protein] synthase-3